MASEPTNEQLGERPPEPYTESEDPEQWARVADWESRRAELLEAELARYREAIGSADEAERIGKALPTTADGVLLVPLYDLAYHYCEHGPPEPCDVEPDGYCACGAPVSEHGSTPEAARRAAEEGEG